MTCALIYHDVVPAGERRHFGFPSATAGRYKLTPDDFDAHLNAIASTGLSVGLIGSNPSVSLTFDDGGASALEAATLLEQRGWNGHFFITTSHVGTRGFLDLDGIRELVARGHDVGSHSHTHPTYMGALTRTEIAREWRQSREILGDIIGSAPTSAAVPGGFLSSDVIEEAARAGYELLMTSTPTVKRKYLGAMLVHGRFTVWATTSPRRIGAYARAEPWARLTMRLGWEAKSASKRLSPDAYEAFRRLVPGVAAARGSSENRS